MGGGVVWGGGRVSLVELEIFKTSISCFLIDIDPIFKLPKNL